MFRIIIAIIAGFIIGGIFNMGTITVGTGIIPPPEGIDFADPDSIAAGMHLFEAKHFVTPFLAHALGTFTGAATAALITVQHKMRCAMIIGVLTLAGGIYASTIIPAPVWFMAMDILLAYLPVAWLAGMLVIRLTGNKETEAAS